MFDEKLKQGMSKKAFLALKSCALTNTDALQETKTWSGFATQLKAYLTEVEAAEVEKA